MEERYREVHMKKEKGMTLVEIIVSLALLGILSIAFINAFTMGFTRIIHAGHRTDAVGQAQASFYANPQIEKNEIISITLPVPSGTTPISVDGSFVKGIVTLNAGTSQEVSVEVLTYMPGKK